jgi:hypothetical protein
MLESETVELEILPKQNKRIVFLEAIYTKFIGLSSAHRNLPIFSIHLTVQPIINTVKKKLSQYRWMVQSFSS